jgi:trehalose 2-sulfotransferase
MQNPVALAFPTQARISWKTLSTLTRSVHFYVIFITARSGSTWLTEMASRSGRLGVPQEWFNETWIQLDQEALDCRPPKLAGTTDINSYIRKTVADYQSQNRIMGLELAFHQTRMLMELLEKPEYVVPRITFFYLRRRNLIAQAISLYRSAESGFFHSYQQNPTLRKRFDSVSYSAIQIQRYAKYLVECERQFEDLFQSCSIDPRRFFYEDLRVALMRVLQWIERTITGQQVVYDSSLENGVIRPVSDNRNVIWESAFRQEHSEELRILEERRPALRGDFRPCTLLGEQ